MSKQPPPAQRLLSAPGGTWCNGVPEAGPEPPRCLPADLPAPQAWVFLFGHPLKPTLRRPLQNKVRTQSQELTVLHMPGTRCCPSSQTLELRRPCPGTVEAWDSEALGLLGVTRATPLWAGHWGVGQVKAELRAPCLSAALPRRES